MKKMTAEKVQGFQPIAPPEPDLKPEQMVQRARNLIPYLREQGPIMEKNRRISDEVNRRIIDNGFYRMLQPRVFGGYEMDLRQYVDVIIEISRGDTSVGWVTSFNAGHAIFAAQLPLEGQIKLFGEDGDFRAPVVTNPFGKAKKVEGGYLVSGNWNYSSGAEVSNWLGVYTVVESDSGDSKPSDVLLCFIRDTEYKIVDNWHVLGMKGTGSKQSVATDVFVPEEMVFSLNTLSKEFKSPGHEVHENPFYRTPTRPILGTQLSAVTVGVAHAALDAFIDYAENKHAPFPPFPILKEERKAQDALGRAIGKLEAAKACLYSLADRQMKRCERVGTDDKFTEDEVVMDIVLTQNVVSLCVETINIVFDTAGSSGAREGSLLEKVFRDINMIRTHYYADHTRTAANMGAIAFGLKPREYF
ncbi:hypothetical protein V7124_08970 [Neobacillus niacini]|uniref:hypothetical protein n=1 Tax=Neobacillus niacini TaxID=86668 RepID=UPI002FFD9B31